MGEWVILTAVDGNQMDAYLVSPSGTALGAVVVVQEIFGVNSQIRAFADRLAEAGYVAIAPAIFDRYEPGLELKDTGDDLQKAFELYGKLSPETALLDVAAAAEYIRFRATGGTAVVGFCYGGLLSWLSATRGQTLGMKLACTVGYYPGGVGQVASETPTCPVMLHFGESDSHIGRDQINAVETAHPEVEIFVYPGADHAFAGTERTAYDPEQAEIAWDRTLAFLGRNLS